MFHFTTKPKKSRLSFPENPCKPVAHFRIGRFPPQMRHPPQPEGPYLCDFRTLPPAPRIECMTLDSLLLSQDPELVRIIRPTLEKLSIDVEVCHEARKAADILISEKFDAVIVDCDDLRGGLEVLQGLRATP